MDQQKEFCKKLYFEFYKETGRTSKLESNGEEEEPDDDEMIEYETDEEIEEKYIDENGIPRIRKRKVKVTKFKPKNYTNMGNLS